MRYIPKLSKLLKFPKLPTTILAPILASEWWICHARLERQRRAVLVVLPFVGARGSGSKYATITLKKQRRAVLIVQPFAVLYVSGSRYAPFHAKIHGEVYITSSPSEPSTQPSQRCRPKWCALQPAGSSLLKTLLPQQLPYAQPSQLLQPHDEPPRTDGCERE